MLEKSKDVQKSELEPQKVIDKERKKIQKDMATTFDAKVFLGNDDLFDLQEYKINQIDRELDLMKSNIFKSKIPEHKKKIKNPENMLTQFLTPILLGILFYISMCGCGMAVISASIINSISIVIQKGDRPKIASFLMTFGVLLFFHCLTVIKFVKSFHAKHLKIGSLFFILTFFINILPLREVIDREYRIDVLVTEFLWSGIEYKEDTNFIASVQSRYKCCGVFNWTDWRLNQELNYNADVPPHKIKLHMTCCKEDASEIIFCLFGKNFYNENCRDKVVRNATFWLRLLVIFFALLQLAFGLAIVFGYVLAKNYQIIKHQEFVNQKLSSVRSQ